MNLREYLKNFIEEKMKDGNISRSDTNEIIKSMVDYTLLEQWKQSGLSTDDFFLQNAIALISTKRSKLFCCFQTLHIYNLYLVISFLVTNVVNG